MDFKYFIKADRIAAWVLFFVVLAFATTGYGMTKGFLDPSLARSLHFNWLIVVGVVAFIVHTSWAIHMAFKRWGIWNNFVKILMVVFYISLFVAFLFLYNLDKSQTRLREHSAVNYQSSLVDK